jgi:branched-chain amino acid transport system substrate-binding protein
MEIHPMKPLFTMLARMQHAVVSLALSLGLGSLACLAHATDISVAQLAPLSGVLASTGQQMVLGGKIYFDWVNDNGGIHGARIKHIVLDDAYKVDETVRLTREVLANPDVVALFGYAGTANIAKLLADGVLDAGGAPLVAPYTGGEALRSPFNPYIFHVRAGYLDETEHMVQQVATLGMTRIAVMYQNDAFGKAGLAGVEAAVARRNMKLVVAASYERNTRCRTRCKKSRRPTRRPSSWSQSTAPRRRLQRSTGLPAAARSCTTSRWWTRPS